MLTLVSACLLNVNYCFSLTNESLDSQSQSQDILFDLHKKVIELKNLDEIEVIHMGRYVGLRFYFIHLTSKFGLLISDFEF